MRGQEIAFEGLDLLDAADFGILNLVDARFQQNLELRRAPPPMVMEKSTVEGWDNWALGDLTDNWDSVPRSR